MLKLLDVRDKLLLIVLGVMVLLSVLTMWNTATILSWGEERDERVRETLRLQQEYDKLLKWYKEKYDYPDR